REWGAPAPAAVAAGHFGPAVVGLRRQTLVLPPAVLGLPEFDLRAVLAHELAHVSTRDSQKLWLAGIGRTLLCWHPLARIGLDALRLQVELAADARAAAWLGDARGYALALGRWGLANAGSRTAPAWGAALAERPAELTVRIQTLLEPGPVAGELRLPAWTALPCARRPRPVRPPLQRRLSQTLILLMLAGYLGLFLLVLRLA
ncbi:MAG TPA: M56 family metallopeptidase, partial [Symbiobacteriaceae bacterium]|nr:M56 family metallopeptidase [Symbiobacteriaceae bacterium]